MGLTAGVAVREMALIVVGKEVGASLIPARRGGIDEALFECWSGPPGLPNITMRRGISGLPRKTPINSSVKSRIDAVAPASSQMMVVLLRPCRREGPGLPRGLAAEYASSIVP